MKRIFYTIDNEIYIDFEALYSFGKFMNLQIEDLQNLHQATQVGFNQLIKVN